MEYKAAGKSGLIVSRIGLGCNNLGRAGTVTEGYSHSKRLIDAAIDAGITLFDTADFYGKEPGLSEKYLGKALGKRRDTVIVATKFGMPMGGRSGTDFGARGARRYIISAVEASLRRLNTDWIDLYQFHTPDPVTPIEETLSALNDLVHQGKVRYIGHSNRAGWQIAEAAHVAQEHNQIGFVTAQNHYNLLDRRAELEVVPACEHYGLGLLPYFPLANGLLTGKYTAGDAPSGTRLTHPDKKHFLDDADFNQLQRFQQYCAARGVNEAKVALSWLAHQDVVPSVIAGATRPEQVLQNAAALEWVPTQADMEELDAIFPAPAPIALF